MEDPFYRENELAAFELMREDYLYVRAFPADEALLACDAVLLVHEHESALRILRGQRVAERTEEPVSYTHLDVYKRQIWKRSPMRASSSSTRRAPSRAAASR